MGGRPPDKTIARYMNYCHKSLQRLRSYLPKKLPLCVFSLHHPNAEFSRRKCAQYHGDHQADSLHFQQHVKVTHYQRFSSVQWSSLVMPPTTIISQEGSNCMLNLVWYQHWQVPLHLPITPPLPSQFESHCFSANWNSSPEQWGCQSSRTALSNSEQL